MVEAVVVVGAAVVVVVFVIGAAVVVVVVGQDGHGAQVGAGGQVGGGGHVMGADVVDVVDAICSQRSQECLHFLKHRRDWHLAGGLHFLWQNFESFLSWHSGVGSTFAWRSSGKVYLVSTWEKVASNLKVTKRGILSSITGA